MLLLIRLLLLEFIDKIDSGNCLLTQAKLLEVLHFLGSLANPNEIMSKAECCDYLGISRATFDNYVRSGFIPKGVTKGGQLKFWNKVDLDVYIKTYLQLL